MAEYRAVRGSILNDEDAEVYGAHLVQLKADNGGITPEDVVEDARNPKSPTHDWFEWDNTEAAEKYRKSQASYLLRSINVVGTVNNVERETKLFYNVVMKERVYVTVEEVLTQEDLRVQVIEEARRALGAWERKYGNLEELFEVAGAIKDFLS